MWKVIIHVGDFLFVIKTALKEHLYIKTVGDAIYYTRTQSLHVQY